MVIRIMQHITYEPATWDLLDLECLCFLPMYRDVTIACQRRVPESIGSSIVSSEQLLRFHPSRCRTHLRCQPTTYGPPFYPRRLAPIIAQYRPIVISPRIRAVK
jgi:hypothetical protein